MAEEQIPGQNFLAGINIDPLVAMFKQGGNLIGGFFSGFGNMLGGLGGGQSASYSSAPSGGSESSAAPESAAVTQAAVAVERSLPQQQLDAAAMFAGLSPEVQGTITAIQRQFTGMGTPASMENLSEGRTMELNPPQIAAVAPQRTAQEQGVVRGANA